jgi:hypothetical protein
MLSVSTANPKCVGKVLRIVLCVYACERVARLPKLFSLRSVQIHVFACLEILEARQCSMCQHIAACSTAPTLCNCTALWHFRRCAMQAPTNISTSYLAGALWPHHVLGKRWQCDDRMQSMFFRLPACRATKKANPHATPLCRAVFTTLLRKFASCEHCSAKFPSNPRAGSRLRTQCSFSPNSAEARAGCALRAGSAQAPHRLCTGSVQVPRKLRAGSAQAPRRFRASFAQVTRRTLHFCCILCVVSAWAAPPHR